jgi:hypothetical protein
LSQAGNAARGQVQVEGGRTAGIKSPASLLRDGGNSKERSMKSPLAASPALVVAGVLLAAPAFAQTMSQPMMNPPAAQPYVGQAATQPYAGQAAAQQQAGQMTLPQGPYLSTCKDARMLNDTLTAFCSKGDGTWQTTQLWQAGRCASGVRNAGGDLVCGMEPQVGSSTPPQGYGSAYETITPPASGTYTPTYPPAPGQTYAPAPGQTYAPRAYNGYGAYGTYNGYGAGVPSSDEYSSSSASKTARPYGY